MFPLYDKVTKKSPKTPKKKYGGRSPRPIIVVPRKEQVRKHLLEWEICNEKVY